MTGLRTLLPLAATLAAACAAASAPAGAQCRLCATPSTEPGADAATPIRIEVQARLDFDQLVFGGGDASVSLSPAGEAQFIGGVSGTGARAMPGSVLVRGEPGRMVRVTLPPRVTLTGEGGALVIEAISSDLPASPRIGDDGTLSFRFGGTLRATGNVDGAYRGDLEIVVDYL